MTHKFDNSSIKGWKKLMANQWAFAITPVLEGKPNRNTIATFDRGKMNIYTI